MNAVLVALLVLACVTVCDDLGSQLVSKLCSYQPLMARQPVDRLDAAMCMSGMCTAALDVAEAAWQHRFLLHAF